MLFTK